MHRSESVPPADRRVLVVGTTADYIQWIRSCRPGQVLFLTDPAIRREADEPAPSAEEELLCDLADAHQVRDALDGHLEKWQMALDGIACYDCESMALAARLARVYALPYPGIQAVDNCRDKYRSRVLWRNHGLDVPEVRRIDSADDAIDFFRETGGPCVLKPLSGSGSELIFRCDSQADCDRCYRRIHQGMERRRDHRLYQPRAGGAPAIIAETFVGGEEYSCDFVLQDDRVTPIRLAHKVRFTQDPFGTAKAYVLPGTWPEAIDPGQFERVLYQSARALGLERAVCMLDFIVKDERMVLLELAPRPGGDCLPSLVRRCYGLDVLQMMLDFARQLPIDVHPPPNHPPMVGLRLHAEKEGVLASIDTQNLRQDPRVQEIQLNRQPGHRIKRPPEDYDAWLLGHVLFMPDPHTDIGAQCRTLCDKLTIEVT